MTQEEREKILQKARDLLPKYGGFVEGAVNQAILLSGGSFDIDVYQKLVDELKEELGNG